MISDSRAARPGTETMGDIELGRHFCLTRPVASLRASHRRHSGSAPVVSSTQVDPCRPLPYGSCDSLVFSQSANAVPLPAPDEAPAQFAAGRPTQGRGPHVDLSPSIATPPTTADAAKSTRRTEPSGRSPSVGLRTDPVRAVPHVEIAERTPIRTHQDVGSSLNGLSTAVAILSPLVAIALGWMVRQSERLHQKIGDNAERVSKLEGRL